MTCEPAPACLAALSQASDLAPSRSEASDGVCSSDYHRATYGDSDHDRGEAFDITHDPAHGWNNESKLITLVANRDVRIKYIIWNAIIIRSYPKPGLAAWKPERYRGPNLHKTHMHVSVYAGARGDVSSWWTIKRTEDDVPKDKDRVSACPCWADGCPGFFALEYDGGVFDVGPPHSGDHHRGSYFSLPAVHRNDEYRRFYSIETAPGQGYYLLGTDGSFYGPTLA